MAHFEKQLSTEMIYRGKVVNLRRDMVELEDGATAAREVIEHPGGVCVLAVDGQDNLLFVTQFRYAVGQELLELPAGKLEYGEQPMECGIRELEEECGCLADSFCPLAELYPTCAYDMEKIWVFLARGLHPAKQRLDEGEFLTIRKIPAAEAYQMVLDGKIIDAKTQLGILKYMALRQAGRL